MPAVISSTQFGNRLIERIEIFVKSTPWHYTCKMHEMIVEPKNRRICFSLSGMLGPAEFESFDASLKMHALSLSSDFGHFDILADLRKALVVPPAQSEQIRAQMKWLVDAGLRKSAHITTSALLSMQIRRMAGDDRFAYFTSEEEARRWLAEGFQ